MNVAHVQQGRTTLIAPFDGTVAKIVGEVGEYSTPSPPGVPTPPAIDLIDESCVYVKAPMDEIDAPKIREGQFVRITLDALPGKSFPRQGAAHRALRLRRREAGAHRRHRGDVRQSRRSRAGCWSATAPTSRSCSTRARTCCACRPRRCSKAGACSWSTPTIALVERKLKTGLSNWEYTEVVDGLAAGDRVVTSLDRAGVKAGVASPIETKPAK